MLEQPRPQDVGGHLGEDAALLGVLLAGGVVVIATVGAVTTADTGVASITCNQTKRDKVAID